jgi:hypothetical protein
LRAGRANTSGNRDGWRSCGRHVHPFSVRSLSANTTQHGSSFVAMPSNGQSTANCSVTCHCQLGWFTAKCTLEESVEWLSGVVNGCIRRSSPAKVIVFGFMIPNRRPRLRYGRADSGLYCREAVEGLEQLDARFVIVPAKRRDWSRNYAKPTESHRPRPMPNIIRGATRATTLLPHEKIARTPQVWHFSASAFMDEVELVLSSGFSSRS